METVARPIELADIHVQSHVASLAKYGYIDWCIYGTQCNSVCQLQ